LEISTLEYDGAFYKSIGDFLGEAYIDFGFTKGTRRQADFLVEALNLPPSSRILDVGCGTGRHSLELARRGYQLVGVDISEGMVAVARKQAADESLPAEFHVADARDLQFGPEFDAAICLCEGAFGLAGSEEGHRRILAGVAQALRPGARFVLTAINAFGVVRRLDIDEMGGVHETRGPGDHLTVEFDPYTATSRQLLTVHNRVGDSREVEIFTTAFTYRELSWLLKDAGFAVEGGYRAYSREPLGIDDTEVMMVAQLLEEGAREHLA